METILRFPGTAAANSTGDFLKIGIIQFRLVFRRTGFQATSFIAHELPPSLVDNVGPSLEK
jgi:hypothetical protein